MVIGFGVVIALIMGWFLSLGQSSTQQPDRKGQETVEQSYLKAAARADEGDIDGALKQYDDAISATTSNDDKRALLVYKSDLASQSGRPDVALEAARQADEIKPDATTAQNLATAYELKGDKANAVLYYKKLIELTPEDSPGERYKGVWEAKIKELEQ